MLAALTNATIQHNNLVEVLTNGEIFYEAELEAIRNAKHNINIEAYIFQKGRVAEQFIAALKERAEAGVSVNLVLDAIGSFATWDSYLKPLRDAGARVEWYHPVRWYTLPRVNNRTGRNSDHLLTRTSSQRLYGQLLKAGAQVFEYTPSMMHAKYW